MKITIADDRQGNVIAIKANNISSAKLRLKKYLKDELEFDKNLVNDFSYEVYELI